MVNEAETAIYKDEQNAKDFDNQIMVLEEHITAKQKSSVSRKLIKASAY